MTHLLDETLQTLADAAKSLPGRRHITSLHRWRLRGIRGVRLEAILIGGKWHTSVEAIRRFVAATTAAASGDDNTSEAPSDRDRRVRDAERELAMEGI